MQILKVFSTENDLPKEFYNLLTKYYEGYGYKINNDTYTRYPALWDLGSEEGILEINNWIFKNGVDENDYCILIHWEW